LFEKQLYKADEILPYAEDIKAVEKYVRDYSPQKVSELTGITASQITQLSLLWKDGG